MSTRSLYRNVHGGFIQIAPKLETTHVSVHGGMDKSVEGCRGMEYET